MDLSIFPTINATLNALAGFWLFLGFCAIKGGNRKAHMRFMTCALVTSAIFLICYVTYHTLRHGAVTRYEGEGIMRIVYFTILLTHTPLALIIVPFSITAVIHAIKGNFEKHVKITRWLYPTWMYVSITGVLIYVILYLL